MYRVSSLYQACAGCWESKDKYDLAPVLGCLTDIRLKYQREITIQCCLCPSKFKYQESLGDLRKLVEEMMSELAFEKEK